MATIVSVHSFRGGTGKSNIAANLAALLATGGGRVGIVDTDIQSPGVHVLFGLDSDTMVHSLNDYLYGRCSVEQTATDVSSVIRAQDAGGRFSGSVFLTPSSIKAGEIARVLREGYEVERLNEGFAQLIEGLALDYLVIDTHPGLNEETLLSITISDALVIVMRPDQQDYQGTAVTIEVARRLRVPRMLLVVNKALADFDPGALAARLEATYEVPVGGVLPLSEDVARLGSRGLFALQNPGHRWSVVLHELARRLAQPGPGNG
jgi:MinD-like ATPase involved in chromosome partitioning or flagellar assembly